MTERRLDLPEPTAPGGRYRTVQVHGGLAWVSGHLPKVDGAPSHRGKVGAGCSVEDAREAARLSMLGCLASLQAALGDLDRVERILRVTGYVASAEGFNRQSFVIDAASDLLVEWFGERGEHARTSIGVYQLPQDVPVELDLVCAVRS
jgi:enamine deaminase RidA (YjgF/YER057c/UK114 family)